MTDTMTDKNGYSGKDIKLARFAKALSHPARLAILRHLASLNTCCFNEISRELPIADSTVSQHMSELKDAGLIQGSFEPPNVKYCINQGNWKLARKYFKKFMNTDIKQKHVKTKK